MSETNPIGSYISPYTYTYTGTELQSVVLPNGMTWTFEYTTDGNADLAEVIFPAGGSISYTGYSQFEPYPGPDYHRAVTTRTLNPNDGITPASTWHYAYSIGSNDIITTVVSAPPSTGSTQDDTVHTFGDDDYETSAQYYQGSHTSGTLLKTVNTQYYSATTCTWCAFPVSVVPETVATIWANGQQAETKYQYDTSLSYYPPLFVSQSGVLLSGEPLQTGATYGRLLYQYDYDFSGSLLRTTSNGYLALNNSTYLNANLLDLPSSVQIKDGGGTQRAYTTYGYDAAGGVHGNLTSTSRWLNTTGGYLTTNNVYDSYGRVTSTTDPNNNTTTYGYTPSTCPSGSGYAGSGPNSVENPLLQTTYYCYDLNTGLPTKTTDPNGLSTGTTYDDMLRVTQISNPDGGSTTFTYPTPNDVDISEKISSSVNRLSYLVVDGVGREIRQATTNGEPSKPYDEVDTCYDDDGRVSFKSYAFQDSGPFATSRACEAPEAGDSFAYDGLSRTKTATHSDGSVISSSYTGNATTVTDEQNKTRESFTDGLGRLEEVIENPGGFGYVTSYGYDALDDLTTVVQNSSRNRTFVYDSLARLTSSTNPEANWSPANLSYVATIYSYDGDGNLASKAEPAQNQTGGSTVTLSYCYDALNRMTSKAYTPQSCPMSSPVAKYSYDQPNCLGQPMCYNIGHRTSMTDAAGSEAWSYTIVSGSGWQTEDQRTTYSLTKSAFYQYNLLSSPTSITYPSGRVINYAYNLGDRPTSATDQTTSVNYANTVHYWAGGSPCWAAYGAAITAAETYNARLQPLNRQATGSVVTYSGSCSGLGQTGNLLDLSYNFNLGSGDNGNVMGITNNRDTTRSQTFGYDALNRLLTAETTSTDSTSPLHCWGETYQFDNQTTGGAWGNLSAITQMTGSYAGCSGEVLAGITVTAQNRISNGSTYYYDTAGNMMTISGVAYNYDAEDHLTSTSGVTYTYDGDGNRVEKTASGTPYKLYWYGIDGSVLDETDQTGSASNGNFSEYVFLGGQRIGRRDYSNNIYYYVTDLIGTSRVIAEVPSGTTTATLCYDADFYPFGGERPPYTNNCTQNYKFTGKERDSESGLDNFGARYFTSNIGRFMSPDPSGIDLADLRDPQQLNLYSYVRNNPLTLTDPYGLDCAYLNDAGNGIESIDQNSNAGECGENGGYWVDQTANANSFHDYGNGFASMQNTNGTSYLFCTGGDCSQPPSFSMGGPPPNDAISNDPLFDSALFAGLGGIPGIVRGGASLLGDLFGTGARAATEATAETTAEQATAQGARIIFGHGARHLAGTGLEEAAVENAIKADITKAVANASTTGNFWGRVVVGGQQIFYRAFTLSDGTINVGTYTVGAP
ncbi:MAG: RHS repeat-associated core domain-containing protein [Candidatus Acidiferrales bacterium]